MFVNDKVALVTGAAQGIGLAISERLANTNTVIMTDILKEKVKKEAEHLSHNGKKVASFPLDAGNEQEVKECFDYIKDKYGRLDILVNNAGISPKLNGQKRMTTDTPLEEWNHVLKINLTGPFLCTREALPIMVSNKWGRIVNISSQAGRTFSHVAGSHYSASKSGLIGFTRSLAYEYGEYGITVNCVAPGRVISPMVKAVSTDINEEFIKFAPVGRLGCPEEVAAAVSYLCSDDAGYVTGSTLDVNGGMFMN